MKEGQVFYLEVISMCNALACKCELHKILEEAIFLTGKETPNTVVIKELKKYWVYSIRIDKINYNNCSTGCENLGDDFQNTSQSTKNMKSHEKFIVGVRSIFVTKIDVWIIIYRVGSTVTVTAHVYCLAKFLLMQLLVWPLGIGTKSHLESNPCANFCMNYNFLIYSDCDYINSMTV